MQQRRILLLLSLFLLGLFLAQFLPWGEKSSAPVFSRQEEFMGTIWSIQISLQSSGERGPAAAAAEAAFVEVGRIEEVMSEWKADSPISRVNRSAGQAMVPVPRELVEMVRRGIAYGELTGGAFDITWRGLGDLWRFDDDFSVPGDVQIESARKRVDFRRIEIEGDRLGIPAHFALGLGGIAKGYAVDRAASVLKEHGLRNFLINGGGDVLASGHRGNRFWTVGVRDPRGGRQQLIARLSVEEGAVVTSGDYERYLIVDGRRYHHIIDPRTGRPAREAQSVTVLADSAERADALATAIFVLGPDEGLELARRLDQVEVFMIDETGELQMTAGMQSRIELLR